MSLKLNERYPGRFNNPSADYPQGSFKNRTAPSAKDGSYLEQDWANDKEGFFQSLLSAAGLEANGSVDKVGASQLFDALQRLKQTQSGTAFPTTGPSAALVLTPSPAIAAYAAGQRFRVKFNRASTGTDTVNISGLGPKPLKQYDSAGAKVSAVFAIDQLADIEYDGTDAVLLDQLPSNNAVAIQGAFKNLQVSASGSSNFVSVSADQIILADTTGKNLLAQSVNVGASTIVVGVNGRDLAAAATPATWYSVWVISNGTTTSCLLSLSATSPTMPSGYTFKARVSWARTDASLFPLRFNQFGRTARYDVGANVPSFPGVTSGSATTAMTIALTGVVPITASKAMLVAGTNSGFVAFAPLGGFVSTPGSNYLSTAQANGFPFAGGWNASGPVPTTSGEINLRTQSVMYASTASTAVLQCMGWEDNL
ncbi:hypothetical protein [Pseudomonas sp. GV047]|uniref:hypothetical protein n=1 Tax=Pseudomonas sp. GV047 TaxID=2135751 RepID=UPI000D4AE6B9|nr:hypothetical protein [Pseudomonas sp. GV047]PUB43239.1 hypothetical protein C8K58_107121 [Pseudomonas sp. GV047]